MKINQLKAGVVLSYMSEAITVLIGLIYTPIMIRLLGQSEYGMYQLAGSTISYLSLLSLGFGSSYVRFHARYEAKQDEKGVARLNGMFMTAFVVIGIICALAGAVLVANVDLMFENTMTGAERQVTQILMALMIFNMSISFPGSVFTSYITAKEQYVFVRVVNILKNIINPFLTLPLLIMGYRSIAVVAVQTVTTVAVLMINAYFCKQKLRMSFNFKNFDFSLLKELFAFSFWIFVNQIIDQINWNVDKFILGVNCGTVVVAIYGVASQLNSMYIQFSTSISSVFAPRVNKIVATQKEDKELTVLFTKVGRIQFLVLALVSSGLVIFGQFFISWWVGNDYGESYYIALLLILPATIPLIQNLGIEIQRAKNMHQLRTVVYLLIAICNLAISIPLARLYGGVGAALGTAGALLLGNGLIMNLIYHRKIGLDMWYFWKQIIALLPGMIIPFVLGVGILGFVSYKSIIVFIILVVVYTSVYAASVWKFSLNSEEKAMVIGPVKAILHRRMRHD